MEAIKKKMQAMKVEKDNLMDRCDNCEQVFLFQREREREIPLSLSTSYSSLLSISPSHVAKRMTFLPQEPHLMVFIANAKNLNIRNGSNNRDGRFIKEKIL